MSKSNYTKMFLAGRAFQILPHDDSVLLDYLIFTMMENYDNDLLREFYLHNFGRAI